MTNTKFRKRALLSSVAMLLVALVALGSATFAWFAANPNATAKGLSLKTTASTGLVIKTDTDTTWSHNALLGVSDANTITGTGLDRNATFINFNLTPVSQGQNTSEGSTVTGHAGTFYTLEAAASGQYLAAKNADIDSTPTAGRSSTDAAYKENVYFRLSDGASPSGNEKVYLKGVTINVNENADMGGAIRVAIADSTGKLIGTYATATGTANGVINSSIDLTGDTYTPAAFSPALAAASTGLSKELPLAGALSTTDSDTNFVTVYVYLDGQDTNCFSDKVKTVNATKIIDSIQVDFSLNA